MFVHVLFVFFSNDTAPTEIYTLSLHDALPIWRRCADPQNCRLRCRRSGSGVTERLPTHFGAGGRVVLVDALDRKSTRLNSSHANISYAVFCLKKKNRSRLNTNSPPTRQLKSQT